MSDTYVKLLLASASPRRRELLRRLDIPVDFVNLREVDETYPDTLAPEEVPCFLSRLKGGAYHLALQPDEVLVTADTVVICDGEVIGKPVDAADAASMLRKLSGKTHTVVTGVTFTTHKGQHTFSEKTDVTFSPLSDEEINYYINTYHPLDKAGAYGIQEWIGFIAVERINGDFYNVMGLPVNRLYHELLDLDL